MKIRALIALVLIVAGCSNHTTKQPEWDPTKPVQRALMWMPVTEQAAKEWGVSPRVITAIIAVESGGNPTLVSKSNAVGLMQIKASTAGADVYRHLGWKGQPTGDELKDPARNISMGAAYLSIMEHGILAGIKDPQTMQYALLVSYANGAGALLRTFSSDRKRAIGKINNLSPEKFYQHVVDKHPSAQAPRYLYKVSRAMDAI